MNLSELVGLKDVVTIEIRGPDGELIELVTLRKKITTVGLNMLRDVIGGIIADAEVKYMAWGSGVGAPAAGDTQLGAEEGRKAITATAAGAAGIINITTYLLTSEANAPQVEELGWFAGTAAGAGINSGIMLGRVLYQRQKTNLETWNVVRTDTFTETP